MSHDDFDYDNVDNEPNGPEQSEEMPAPDDSGVSMWDDPNVLDSLKMEREVHPDESPEDMARRFLREAVPNATQGLIRLALSASNENTRLNAQKVILSMVLTEGEAAKASWEDFVADAVSEAELHANTNSSGSDR
jgi:hypothetical protein